MASLSRRKLIAAAAVAPLAGAVSGAHAPPFSAIAAPKVDATRRSKPDPLLARTAAWIAERDAIDAMMHEWQDQETALCERIKPMTFTQAYRCHLPEARAMRALDRKIKTGLRRLDRTARAIVLLRPVSAEGALAKIRMSLRIQGPYDWEDYAFALAQDGYEQLALMLTRVEEPR
jgi:hypothetical protein